MAVNSIRDLFTRIAPNYDIVNRLIALGQDRRWRKEALAYAHLSPGDRLLDVATGTGDVALMAAADHPEVRVVGIDVTRAMLDIAREKGQSAEDAIPETGTGAKRLAWMLGDGLVLPFRDNAFDAVTSAFMMRNVPDVLRAFQEQQRVVRPGGPVICLELTWPRRLPMSLLFQWYFFGWTPLVGRLLSGDREAYQYLPRSVKQFLTPEAMARQMEQAGLCDVAWRTKMGATVAIYTGFKR